MGFHIIVQPTNTDDMQYHYVEKINDLANFNLEKHSIIYEGEKKWKPTMLKHSNRFVNFSHDWHRVGIKAQELFRKQSIENNFMIEELSQDQESFKGYTNVTKDFLNIKRGDFLIRNYGNLEIEVKCRNIKWDRKKKYYFFYFNAEHLEKHLNMMKLTKTPILIAIYKRKKDEPLENSLRMIEVSYMKKLIIEKSLIKEPQKNSKGEKYFVYRIPLKHTMEGFKLVEYLKTKKKLNV